MRKLRRHCHYRIDLVLAQLLNTIRQIQSVLESMAFALISLTFHVYLPNIQSVSVFVTYYHQNNLMQD